MRRVAAALLFAVAFGTNVPTPLLLIYRVDLDLSASTLAAIFGVYALGLAPSLLLGGPASDRFGRVRVMLPATVLVTAASLVFLPGSQALWLLFAARFLQGLASGAVFSVGSAWLQDLSPGDSAGAARTASVAQTLGFCLGPLTSGLLATFAPLPLVLPYLVHVGLTLVAVVLTLAVVGTGTGPVSSGARPGFLPRPGLTGRARRIFAGIVVPTAVCVYAFPSVSVTVLPLLLPGRTGLVAFTGLLAALTLGTGTLVQPVAHRLGAFTGPVGAGLGAAGFGVAVLAAATQSVVVVGVSGVLLGAGGGLCINAGLTLVGRLAAPERRGACNGIFYTAAYLGFAMPFLATSFVDVDELAAPLAVLAVAAAVTAAWLALRRPSM